MLDSSPIRGPVSFPGTVQAPPPPPKKLKRSASVASLPSPPPTVQPPRKRAGRIGLKPRKGAYAGDSDAEQDDDGDDDGDGGGDEFILEGDENERDSNKAGVLGRMILFPTASSLKLPNEPQDFVRASPDDGVDGEDDPFVVRGSTTTKSSFGLRSASPIRRSLSPVRRSPRLQAAANIAPVLSTPVKAKSQRSPLHSLTRPSTRSNARKPKDEKRGICKPHEIPVIDDADDNPFFVKTSPKSKNSASKGRGRVLKDVKADGKEQVDKPEKDEKPTIVYVFKGVKTHLPNPYYNLSPSAYEKAKLPLDHPDYEPLPAGPSKLDFKRSNKVHDDATTKGEGSSNRPGADSDEEEEEEEDDEEKGESDVGDHPSGYDDSSPRPPEPRTPENKPRVKYSGFKSESGKPVLDSGPEGVRGSVMDPDEIGRMAVGPARDGGSLSLRDWQREKSGGSDIY